MLNQFDESFYNTLMNIAYEYLKNNQQRYGQEFSELFISNHDLANGPQTHNHARNLYDYVQRAMQHLNGSLQATNQQMFEIIAKYVEEIAVAVSNNQQRQRQMGGGFGQGGFGQQGGFGRQPNAFGNNNGGFGTQNNGGFGQQGFGRQQQRPGSSSALRDDSVTPIQQAAPVTPQVSPIIPTMSTQIISPSTSTYVVNPLDSLSALKDGIDFSQVPEAPNWGETDAVDDSIVIMVKESYKSSDHKYVVRKASAFNRIYTNDELDVVNEFFRVSPATFQAENFLIEIFYNHVQVIDVPTKMFLETQDAFLNALNREATAYRAVIGVLNSMFHGPRMAMANYLVAHINRALYKCCRMTARPTTEINFTQIEDLEELLGTSFNHPILDIPNARTMLQDIVNNAIKAALSGYSAPMFTSDKDAMMSDIIRTSSAFPFAIANVYPAKTVIPSYGDKEFEAFYTAFSEQVLEHKTYVRSVRSVIISNIFGGQELSKIGSKAERIFGATMPFMSMFKTQYRGSIGIGRNETEQFDELFKNDIPEQDYADYIQNPDAYLKQMKSRFSEIDPPRYPVDRTLYFVQFKKSPKDYLKAVDIITALDEPSERSSGIFVTKDISALHLVK